MWLWTFWALFSSKSDSLFHQFNEVSSGFQRPPLPVKDCLWTHFSFMRAFQSILKWFGKRWADVKTYWHAVWQDKACLSPPRLVSKWNCYTNCCAYSRADNFHRLLPCINNKTSWLFLTVGTNHLSAQFISPISIKSNQVSLLTIRANGSNRLVKDSVCLGKNYPYWKQ